LNIALAYYAKVPNDIYCGRSQHVEIDIGQRL